MSCGSFRASSLLSRLVTMHHTTYKQPETIITKSIIPAKIPMLIGSIYIRDLVDNIWIDFSNEINKSASQLCSYFGNKSYCAWSYHPPLGSPLWVRWDEIIFQGADSFIFNATFGSWKELRQPKVTLIKLSGIR